MKNLLLFVAIALFLSCSKDSDSSTGATNSNNNSISTIDPSDADAISNALILPSQAVNISGSLPEGSGAANEPRAKSDNTTITTSNGSTAPLSIKYNNVTRKLGGCYIQVEGASSHYHIPLNVQTIGDSGEFQLPIGIPTNVVEGQFTLKVSVYDTDKNDVIGQSLGFLFNVLKLGSGNLQISLSWDTDTDQDLYVVDPSNDTIYYERETVTSGGRLDRDDTDGQGPENIYWEGSAPDGTYHVLVHDYDNTQSVNNCFITISSGSFNKSFEVTTQNGSKPKVTSFTKSGSQLNF